MTAREPTAGARFRAVLERPPLVVPGVFDALSAKLAERHGFRAAYQSGAALSAGLAALPDVGLLTQTEFAEEGARLAEAVEIPILSDADTGFGEALSVERTVRLFESAGLAGCTSKISGSPSAADT
jgi:methylisocitrate lyase